MRLSRWRHCFAATSPCAGILTWLALLGLCLSGWVHADTLYLREGEQAEGRLVKMDAENVFFDTQDGEQHWPKAEVTKVQLQRARMHDDITAASQIADPDLKQALENPATPEDFPAEGYVTQLERKVFDLTEPGIVRETTRVITRILQQRGEDAGSVNVWYFEDTDQPQIDFALTVTPDGRVLHLSDAAVKNESIFAGLPDYRRLARYRFACKEPRPGSMLDVQHTVVRKRDSMLEPFYADTVFRRSAPVLRKEVVVLVPSAREETVAWVQSGPEVVEYSREEAEGGLVRLSWTLAEPQPGIRDEPHMPPLKDFAPSLTLASAYAWEDLAEAYAQALAAVPALPEEAKMKAKALAEEGGAQAVYNFVARTVRTVPVPHLRYSLTPHAPGETLQRGLANELDKNHLLLSMLEAAGIDASFVLVRDRDQGDLPESAPSLRAFGSSAVLIGKKTFVTSISDQLEYGFLPGGMQDAVVFRADASKPSGILLTTPLADPGDEPECTKFEAALAPSGDLALTVTYTATGNAASWFRSLKDLDEQALRNTMQQVAASYHPAAALESFDTSDLADLNERARITLKCNIPGFAVKAGDEFMLLNLPVVAYSAADVGRPSREYGMFWSRPVMEECEGFIQLPEGFSVYALPGKASFKSPALAYRARVKNRGHGILFKDRLVRSCVEAPAEAYGEYKTGMEVRANIPRQRIILIGE